MIAHFLERCLCVPHDLLYSLQLRLRRVDRLVLGHAVPVVRCVGPPQHEVGATEGAEPGLRAAARESAVPVHVVHLLLEAAALRPVEPLLLLHETELLLPPLPELLPGL